MQVRFAGPAGAGKTADAPAAMKGRMHADGQYSAGESRGVNTTQPDTATPDKANSAVNRLSVDNLIDAYGDDILRLCLLYLGDRQLAEDAFQVTMVKAWQQLSTFRGESSAKTWLSHIAANACRDAMRSGWFRMRRKSEPIETLFDLAAPQETGADSAVRDAVLALPGKYREVVVLYYFEDMKLREIAELLRIPVNSVSTRLHRARALLAGLLGEEVDAQWGRTSFHPGCISR